jgi:hypothetical protein
MLTSERTTLNGKRQAGYFSHMRFDEKHTGGILVTNQIGVPLEFKYTEPVVVTGMHRILYGSSLERYLHETVIRDRLARELRSEPEFFLCPYDEKEYLAPMASREMIAVQRLRAGQSEAAGPFTRIREREAIVEMEEGIQLRLAFSSPDESVQNYAAAWLQELGRTMDVTEPLERLAGALRTLCGNNRKA